MKLISKQEYDELMKFMQPKLRSLWNHENNERKKQGKEPLNVFQFGFSIMDIDHYYIDDNYDFYLVFNSTFLNLIYSKIQKAMEKFPEKFGTGNANDVIDAIYAISAFDKLGDKDEYVRFLIDHPCCYIVYRKNNEFEENILRIDILRLIKTNKEDPTKSDFIGGLMHTLKHFSIDDKNLSTGTYVHNVFDIHYIVYLIAMAFRLKTGERCTYKAIQELSNAIMLASFYKEEVSGIYFLNSYYKKKSIVKEAK